MKQRRTPTLTVIGWAVAATLGSHGMAAHADELQDMKKQVEVLLKRMAELEAEQAEQKRALARAAEAEAKAKETTTSAQASAAKPVEPVTAGTLKGSFKVPGTNTSVLVAGYAKLDAVYSDKSAGVASSADQLLNPTAIPLNGSANLNNERHQLKLHARQSRFLVRSATPSEFGDVTSWLEWDLFGDIAGSESVSNSNNLRLRHAYGSVGAFGAGQFWTLFGDPATYPETLDFGGPVGQVFVRQAQVRWTVAKWAGGSWAVSLENPESVVLLPAGTTFRADDDRYPDVITNLTFLEGKGRYVVSALGRQIRVDSASAPVSRQQKTGYALNVSGLVPIGGSASQDDFRFQVSFGNALGRYITGYIPDGVLNARGDLSLPNQYAWFAAYRFYWSQTVRSTLSLSGVGENYGDGTAGAAFRRSQSAHLNLVWSPSPQTNLGIEYIAANRRTEGGGEGSIRRVQTSAQYSF